MITECTVIKELEPGSQKKVTLASHPSLGMVVIKKGKIESFDGFERIRREVETVSKIDSSFYPKQFHFSIDVMNNEFIIIEEYIEGSNLRSLISTINTPKLIFNLLHKLCNGLSIIWEQGIVHRDLKPENIIIKKDGSPCILDLGIAKFSHLERLTQSIWSCGPCTPAYASPEQLTNKKHLIDIRTDFFALGIICLELYLGKNPFDPSLLGNKFSIPENILQNNYVTQTLEKDNDESISNFAHKTLQSQSYNRFKDYEVINSFIIKHI